MKFDQKKKFVSQLNIFRVLKTAVKLSLTELKDLCEFQLLFGRIEYIF